MAVLTSLVIEGGSFSLTVTTLFGTFSAIMLRIISVNLSTIRFGSRSPNSKYLSMFIKDGWMKHQLLYSPTSSVHKAEDVGRTLLLSQKIISRWQHLNRKGCTPDSTNKEGWFVMIRSIHDLLFSRV